MLDLLAFGRKVEVFGIHQHVVESHQTGRDGLGLVSAAITAVLVANRSIERPKTQVEHPPIVGENMPAAMAAIQ
jgi:hypothetical protein